MQLVALKLHVVAMKLHVVAIYLIVVAAICYVLLIADDDVHADDDDNDDGDYDDLDDDDDNDESVFQVVATQPPGTLVNCLSTSQSTSGNPTCWF